MEFVDVLSFSLTRIMFGLLPSVYN